MKRDEIGAAIRAATLHAKAQYPGLGEDVYDELAQATAEDLLKKPPGSVKTATGLAIAIIKKKLAKHFDQERVRRDREVADRGVVDTASVAEIDTDQIDAARLRRGFRTLKEQEAALRGYCEGEFKKFVGRAWGGDGEAAWFRGDASAARRADDRAAQGLIERLRGLIAEIDARVGLGKQSLEDRQLAHFAVLLRGLADDVQWKVWQPRRDLKFVDNFRSLFVAEHDHANFFGLRRRAEPRELAIISLLCGSYPGRKKDKALSIEKLLAAEMRAIGVAQGRYGGMRDFRRRERSKTRGRKPKR